MINVDLVKRMVDDLSRGQAGAYSSPDDFNQDQELAQSLLMDYYIHRHDHIDYESLAPFIVEANVMTPGSILTAPSDLRKCEAVDARIVKIVDGVVQTTKYGCIYVNAVAVGESKKSTIRGGSKEKNQYWYYQVASGWSIYPDVQRASIRYIKNPPNAVWGSTLDSVNAIYNYNSGTSTNFVWNSKDTEHLVDCFLFLRGIRTKQSDLLNWLNAKNSLQQ